jgi:Spy/CpxP family protein refolding chaperone
MKRLLIVALLALPLAAVAQDTAPLPPLPPFPDEGGTFVAQVHTSKKGGPGSRDVIYFRRSAGMGNWWKNSDVVKQLGTSDAQVQQIERIYQDSRMRLIDLKANLEKEEARLEPLVEADNPDEGLISSQIDKVAASRAELEKSNALMQVAIRRVLTLDQWKKLQSLEPELGTRPVRVTVPLPPHAPAAPVHVVQPAAPAAPPRM